jgi:hypothetical protein
LLSRQAIKGLSWDQAQEIPADSLQGFTADQVAMFSADGPTSLCAQMDGPRLLYYMPPAAYVIPLTPAIHLTYLQKPEFRTFGGIFSFLNDEVLSCPQLSSLSLKPSLFVGGRSDFPNFREIASRFCQMQPSTAALIRFRSAKFLSTRLLDFEVLKFSETFLATLQWLN